MPADPILADASTAAPTAPAALFAAASAAAPTAPAALFAAASAAAPTAPAAITLTGEENPNGFSISGTGIADVDGDYSEFLIIGQTQWKKSVLGNAYVQHFNGQWQIRNDAMGANNYFAYCISNAATPVGLTYTLTFGSLAPTVTGAARSAPAAITAARSAVSPTAPSPIHA